MERVEGEIAICQRAQVIVKHAGDAIILGEEGDELVLVGDEA
jgi:hypothetical protein